MLIIQCGKRFVQQQQLRRKSKRAYKCGFLLHSSRKLTRIIILKRSQSVTVQQLRSVCMGFGIQSFFDFQPKQGILFDCAPIKKMIALKHVARAVCTRIGRCAENLRLAGARLQYARKNGQKARFAAAGRPDYRNKLPLVNG